MGNKKWDKSGSRVCWWWTYCHSRVNKLQMKAAKSIESLKAVIEASAFDLAINDNFLHSCIYLLTLEIFIK